MQRSKRAPSCWYSAGAAFVAPREPLVVKFSSTLHRYLRAPCGRIAMLDNWFASIRWQNHPNGGNYTQAQKINALSDPNRKTEQKKRETEMRFHAGSDLAHNKFNEQMTLSEPGRDVTNCPCE